MMLLNEGGVDFVEEEFCIIVVKDRIDMMGFVWMGFFVGCAKCYLYKYDLIS